MVSLPVERGEHRTGKEGLHAAQCNDFPTFHTRMDVAWTGLSDAEVQALRRAEELVACGVLLGILIPERGALNLALARERLRG